MSSRALNRRSVVALCSVVVPCNVGRLDWSRCSPAPVAQLRAFARCEVAFLAPHIAHMIDGIYYSTVNAYLSYVLHASACISPRQNWSRLVHSIAASRKRLVAGSTLSTQRLGKRPLLDRRCLGPYHRTLLLLLQRVGHDQLRRKALVASSYIAYKLKVPHRPKAPRDGTSLPTNCP